MKLNVKKIEGIKPTSQVFRVSDGDGLHLEIRPTGSKIWRFRFQKMDGKFTMISLGKYPAVTLKAARDKAADKRRLIAEGVDISGRMSDGKFHSVFEDWFKKYESQWTPGHAQTVRSRIENNVLPWIGEKKVSEITSLSILAALERIQDRGAIETAHRVLQIINKVFTFAVSNRLCENNPAIGLNEALAPKEARSFPAPTEPAEVSRVLQAIEGYKGAFVTKCALRLFPMTMLRPGEFRHGEWSEIDFDECVWLIPAEKMKVRRNLKAQGRLDHMVPLSRQAVGILKELHPLTGDRKYIFEGSHRKGRPMSENTLVSALRGLGFEKDFVVAHSFRSIASTMLNEREWPGDWIEKQLHHIVGNKVRGIYNRAQYLPQRRRMMQAWSDYLDYLRQGGKSIEKLAMGQDIGLAANQ